MDPVAGTQLGEGLLLLQRFECYLGFELRTVVVSLCRHLVVFSLVPTQRYSLCTCPVFGEHYRVCGSYRRSTPL
jgi:hypothetical protein